MRHAPQTNDKLADAGELLDPHEAAEPILAKPVRGALLEWLTEIWAEEELKAANLVPRRRALFGGKPGTGKTTLAHHLAARLGLPMLVVRPERLIDTWVGSTGRNIGALFDLAAKSAEAGEPVLIFFDEFDTIAITRSKADTGAEEERNAWVNTLLQRIEQHDGYIVAATNFPEHIDQAVWRRFDVHITIELPGLFERERILERYLEPWAVPPEALKRLAQSLDTASPALMRQFAEGLKRQIVVGPKVGWNMQREAVIDRLLAAIQPHPTLGKPGLWSKGSKDDAVRGLPWPLPLKADLPALAAVPESHVDPDSASNVTTFPRKALP